jgi:hypothetical protein
VAMSEAISAFCQIFGLDDVSPREAPHKVACGPWVTTHAADSARRCITALVGPSPSSLPNMMWIWSGSARGTASRMKTKLPWPKFRGLTRPPRARVQCWRPPSRHRFFRSRHRPRAGRILPRVEMKPRVQLLPRAMPDSARAVYSKYVRVFRGRRGLNTLSP